MQESLKQKVQGAILHGSPNRYFLHVCNESIPSDSNFNIECVRRVLMDAASLNGGKIKSPLYLQADNAGPTNSAPCLWCTCV